MEHLNVFGQPVITCSNTPLTGFFRDGCCNSDSRDHGNHAVCAVMTDDFLQFSLAQGNDLITPRPEFNFTGLKAGDRWCLCAARWKEAFELGCAPKVILEATHERCLEVVSIDELILHAFKAVDNARV